MASCKCDVVWVGERWQFVRCGYCGAEIAADLAREALWDEQAACENFVADRFAAEALAEGDNASTRTHVSRPGDSGLGAPSASAAKDVA